MSKRTPHSTAHETPEHEIASGTGSAPVRWSYDGEDGPENWGSLDPSFGPCAEGRAQSPVDIPAGAPVNPDDIGYAYAETATQIVNDGCGVQVNVDKGGMVEFHGNPYILGQFHFHSPSEHTLAGCHTEMEMHLVHTDADGSTAVIGVMLVEGAENSAYAPICDNMPTAEGGPVTIESARVNVGDLLPKERSYYHYTGSLTTPPCTEEVLWYVLTQPVQLSARQIAVFRAVHDNTNRPIQPMNDRMFKRLSLS